MRNTMIVCLAVVGLTLCACSKAEQADTTQHVKAAGDKASEGVKDTVNDVASDEDVKKARAEVDRAAAEAGAAVKGAASEAGQAVKAAAADATKEAALNAKQAIHEATAPTPEEERTLAKRDEAKK
jgi:hypothetical protein